MCSRPGTGCGLSRDWRGSIGVPGSAGNRAVRGTRVVVGGVGWLALGSGVGLMIASGLGVSPYDALATGVAATLGVSVSVALVLASIFLVGASLLVSRGQRRPRWGTVVGPLVVSAALGVSLSAAHGVTGGGGRVGIYALGFTLLLVGISAIAGSEVGLGPLELFMFALVDRGAGIAVARWALEGAMVIAAFALGGELGWGTLVVALASGPILARTIPRAQRWCAGGGRHSVLEVGGTVSGTVGNALREVVD